MHRAEAKTTTASGPLALAALPNSRLLLHGVEDQPIDLQPLHQEGRRVLLLYPGEEARVLTPELVRESPLPVTLIVPDGSWRQASRAARRVPGTAAAEKVKLASGPPTEWGLRRETKPFGLSTFEAIARALGVLEGANVQEALEAVFRESVRRQLQTRPQFEAALAPTGASQPATESQPAAALPELLYRDEWLVAIDKPSGYLVHRGWGQDGPVALEVVRDQLGQTLYPVHRLDRQTSGVLLFALYPEVARDLQAAFERGGIDKRYLALCRGCDAALTHVDRPLTKEPGKGERKPAHTDLELVARSGRYGLYRAWPRSGRTHQIRRHLKHASHPIIGDVRYGKGDHNRLFREEYDFHRLALHCESVGLLHPRTGQPLCIEARLPPDFSGLLERLAITWPA